MPALTEQSTEPKPGILLLFQVDSFFNFFSPPDVPGEDEEMEEEAMEELQALIEADYEVK